MKLMLKLAFFACSLQAPIFASYQPLNQENAPDKKSVELADAKKKKEQEIIPAAARPTATAPAESTQWEPETPQRCFRTYVCALSISAIIMVTINIIVVKLQSSADPSSKVCVSPDTDMTNKCYDVTVSQYESCPHWAWISGTACPANGTVNAGQLIQSMQNTLNTTSGDNARYCVAPASCSSNRIQSCNPGAIAELAVAIKLNCIPNKPAHNLRTKFMKRSNNRKAK